MFTQKYHNIHGDSTLHLPKELYVALSDGEHISSMFWTDHFSFSQTILVGIQSIRDFLCAFADEKPVPDIRRLLIRFIVRLIEPSAYIESL